MLSILAAKVNLETGITPDDKGRGRIIVFQRPHLLPVAIRISGLQGTHYDLGRGSRDGCLIPVESHFCERPCFSLLFIGEICAILDVGDVILTPLLEVGGLPFSTASTDDTRAVARAPFGRGCAGFVSLPPDMATKRSRFPMTLSWADRACDSALSKLFLSSSSTDCGASAAFFRMAASLSRTGNVVSTRSTTIEDMLTFCA